MLTKAKVPFARRFWSADNLEEERLSFSFELYSPEPCSLKSILAPSTGLIVVVIDNVFLMASYDRVTLLVIL